MSSPQDTPPIPEEFRGEPGWDHLTMPRQFGSGRSFVSGEPEGDRLRIYYYLRTEDGALCAKVWFGLGAEGPPGHAHGGSMAAVLDEAMGFIAWVSGHPVVAANINITFRKRLPLEEVLEVEARIHAVEDSKVIVKGRIHDPKTSRVFAEGEGLFIEQPIESFGALIGTRHLARKEKQQRTASE